MWRKIVFLGLGGWSFSGNLRIFFDQEMAEQEKMQALVRSREKKLLLVANKYHLCGFDDQDSAYGPGQWRGLEIGNCEEEAASSAGSEAACQIEETRISTGKELEVTIHQQQQQWCFPQGVQEQEQEQDFFDLLPDHLVIEILVRVATPNWPMLACVHRRWAAMFRGDGLWQTALTKRWPHAGSAKRWPGPISRGSSKRCVVAPWILFAKLDHLFASLKGLSLSLSHCLQEEAWYFLILYLELHHKFQIWQSLLSRDRLPKEYDWQLIHVMILEP